jgi:hypothetical protein
MGLMLGGFLVGYFRASAKRDHKEEPLVASDAALDTLLEGMIGHGMERGEAFYDTERAVLTEEKEQAEKIAQRMRAKAAKPKPEPPEPKLPKLRRKPGNVAKARRRI